MTFAVAVLAGAMLSVAPVSGGAITLAPVNINVSPGEQYDPHVDQNLAAYSELVGFDQLIHYYQFGPGTDQVIARPAVGTQHAQDFLSDVQGGRVVFNRYTPGGDTGAMLFDVATSTVVDINPQPGSIRFGVSIGAGTVAYADMSVVDPAQQIGEIFYWNVATHEATRLTNDLAYDDGPSVAPAGDVIVWESCTAPYVNCDIKTARPAAGGGWTVSVVAGTALSEMEPDTSSTTTAWEANPGDVNGWDIHWVPVGSTAAQRLQLADNQYHPAVAGDVIAFESQNPTTLHSDLFLYDIATNRVFQLTNTPAVDETLNDITQLATGELRIVWQANDDFSTGLPSNNIYGATFSLPAVKPPSTCSGDDDDCDDDDDHDGDNTGGHHGGGHGHDHGHAGRHDVGRDGSRHGDAASRHQELGASEPMPAYGCSSSGNSAMAGMVIFTLTALMLRPRRREIRARVRR